MHVYVILYTCYYLNKIAVEPLTKLSAVMMTVIRNGFGFETSVQLTYNYLTIEPDFWVYQMTTSSRNSWLYTRLSKQCTEALK